MVQRPPLQLRFSLQAGLLWVGLLGIACGSCRFLPPLCAICLVYTALVASPVWELSRQRQQQVEQACRRSS